MRNFILVILLISTTNLFSQYNGWKNLYNSYPIETFAIGENNIFVGQENGLIVVDKSDLTKTYFNTDNSILNTNKINKIVIGIDKRVWIGTDNGLLEYVNGELDIFYPSDDLLTGDHINDMAVSSDNVLYLATQNGIIIYNNNKFSKFEDSNLNKSYATIDIQDSILLMTMNVSNAYFSIKKYNLETSTYKDISNSWDYPFYPFSYKEGKIRYVQNGKLYYSDGHSTSQDVYGQVFNKMLNSGYIDKYEREWYGTDEKLILHSENDWVMYPVEDSLSVNEIYLETEDIVWFTASKKGIATKFNELYKLNLVTSEITPIGIKTNENNYLSNNALEIENIGNGNMLVSYDNGLTEFKGTEFVNHFLTFDKLNAYYEDNILPRNITYIDDEKFLFTMDNHIYLTNLDYFHRYYRINNAHIYDVEVLNDGRVWFADMYRGVFEVRDSSLYLIHKELGFDYKLTFTQISQGQGNDIWFISDNQQKIIHNNGTENIEYDAKLYDDLLFLTASASIWSDKLKFVFGTYKGELITFDGETAHNYNSLNSNAKLETVNKLLTDKNQNIWIASDNGLWYFDGEEFQGFTISNSDILSDIVRDIAFDHDGNLWLATDKGISIVSPAFLITGVEDNNDANNGLAVYPNPASDFIEISIDGAHLEGGHHLNIEIYDVLGNLVLSDVRHLRDVGHLKRIDVSQLPKGVYFVKIGDRVEKFVKL